MSFDSVNDQDDRQFGYFHRILGYLILTLLMLVYVFDQQLDIKNYLPIFFLYLLFAAPRIDRVIQYKFRQLRSRDIFFLLDSMAVATALAGLNLSLVLSFILLFALFYNIINNKIPFLIVSMACVLVPVTFYISVMALFGTQQYFQPTSQELTIIGLICLITFVNIGNYYQQSRIRQLTQSRHYYYNQMTRYMAFANQLSRYAPLQLWQAIMRGDSEAKIEYKRQKMTIFFSDIQGFTELSERLIPDDLAFVLNDYLSHMTEIAKQFEGTIDKFMGDAILIFFGAPSFNGEQQDATRCVEMALAMRQQMQILRERWLKMGFPALNIRMGISTGYCHVGNYGAHHRMSYTIVGRDANLAARIQYAADIDEILISEQTYRCIHHDFLCVPKAPLQLKGIQGDVKTWQVVEKFQHDDNTQQQWFDYNYKGFHLVLNFEQIRHADYAELIQVLEKMMERVSLQRNLTTSQGIAKLNAEDAVFPTDLNISPLPHDNSSKPI